MLTWENLEKRLDTIANFAFSANHHHESVGLDRIEFAACLKACGYAIGMVMTRHLAADSQKEFLLGLAHNWLDTAERNLVTAMN